MAKLNNFFSRVQFVIAGSQGMMGKKWFVTTAINAPPYQLSYGSDDEFIRHRKLKNFIQRKCMKSPGNSRWFEN